MMLIVIGLLAWICLQQITFVNSHARLMSPPSRSSMWRLGFPTRKNFNDNALYCGGIHIQWQINKGKCGICGDAYHMPHPRDNEAGGKYASGIISRRYLSGQVIKAVVDVTTNHRGYFEFKLCPSNNPKKEVSQECLDKYTLKQPNGRSSRVNITGKGRGNITTLLQLPKDLICSHCVFQWTYVAGNNWGRCDNGTSRIGCGPQETFRGCADIEILKPISFQSPETSVVINNMPLEFNFRNFKDTFYKTSGNPEYLKYFIDPPKMEHNNSDILMISKNPNDFSRKANRGFVWKIVNFDDDTVDDDTWPYFNVNSFLFNKTNPVKKQPDSQSDYISIVNPKDMEEYKDIMMSLNETIKDINTHLAKSNPGKDSTLSSSFMLLMSLYNESLIKSEKLKSSDKITTHQKKYFSSYDTKTYSLPEKPLLYFAPFRTDSLIKNNKFKDVDKLSNKGLSYTKSKLSSSFPRKYTSNPLTLFTTFFNDSLTRGAQEFYLDGRKYRDFWFL